MNLLFIAATLLFVTGAGFGSGAAGLAGDLPADTGAGAGAALAAAFAFAMSSCTFQVFVAGARLVASCRTSCTRRDQTTPHCERRCKAYVLWLPRQR